MTLLKQGLPNFSRGGGTTGDLPKESAVEIYLRRSDPSLCCQLRHLCWTADFAIKIEPARIQKRLSGFIVFGKVRKLIEVDQPLFNLLSSVREDHRIRRLDCVSWDR